MAVEGLRSPGWYRLSGRVAEFPRAEVVQTDEREAQDQEERDQCLTTYLVMLIREAGCACPDRLSERGRDVGRSGGRDA